MFVVFDLDGTLSDDTHRHHYLDETPKNWDGYNAEVSGDSPIWPVIDILRAMAEVAWMEPPTEVWHHGYTDHCHRIEIWTGRPESIRKETETWLAEHKVPYMKLRMRVDGDFRSAKVTKQEWMDEAGTPDLMFEDRAEYVDYYRSLGITVMDVAGHTY